MMRLFGPTVILSAMVWGQPNAADHLYKDAGAAAQKGDYPKAEFLLRDMRLEAPNDERWLTVLMGVLNQQNKWQEAIKVAREVEPQFAKSPTFHLQLGAALQQIGRLDEALKEFESALALSQTNAAKASAYGAIGYTRWRFGDEDAAISAYRKSKEFSGPPSVILAELLMGKGERDEAIAEFRAVLRVMPNNAAALHDLASTWANHEENLDEALQFARRAAALQPGFALVTDTLGWVLFKKGMLVDAEETTIRSMGQEGGTFPATRRHLAAIMDSRGEWTAERRELRRLLDGELSADQLAQMKLLLRKTQGAQR